FQKVQCEQGMDFVNDVIRNAQPKEGGGYTGRLGKLPLMMLQGGILLLDEIASVPPERLQPLLGVTGSPNSRVAPSPPTLDLGGYLGEETTVTAKPGFFIIGTGNYREGQGAGEIAEHSDREERRVRPFMLGALPPGTKMKRMANRHRTKPLGTDVTTVSTLPRHRYYPPELLEIPDDCIDAMAGFFERVHTTIATEILPLVKQDPKVYLREIIDRAFDHFMRFQIQKEGAPTDPRKRIEEMLESAVMALEFYYLNTFRTEKTIKCPDIAFFKEVTQKDEIPAEVVALRDPAHPDKIALRPFVAWRIKSLLNLPLWEVNQKRVNIQERLKQILEPTPESPPPSELSPEAAAALAGLGDLLKKPPPPPAGEASPEQKDVLKDFEHQFEKQLTNLFDFGVTDSQGTSQVPSILDNADGLPHWYPAPKWEQVRAALTPEKLQLIAQLENPTLLLVPEGMSLMSYLLKVQAATNDPDKKMSWNNADAFDVNSDVKDQCISEMNQYDPVQHGGTTKRERLSAPNASEWQVLVVDGGDEPPASTLGGSADQLLRIFRKQGFGGLSLEARLALHMKGQVEDKPLSRVRTEWLLESYLPNSTDASIRGAVLVAKNSPTTGHSLNVFRVQPDYLHLHGARRSVRVL
ncbi:MAG: hypothetical protein UW70_C0038G0001, partial [Candidatus Peregrinibacteria bacterium GW2011_GWA2_44_7]